LLNAVFSVTDGDAGEEEEMTDDCHHSPMNSEKA
jgi:hypothetical protein